MGVPWGSQRLIQDLDQWGFLGVHRAGSRIWVSGSSLGFSAANPGFGSVGVHWGSQGPIQDLGQWGSLRVHRGGSRI